MPGVGSAKAGDYLFNQASRDGLTLGMIGQQLVVSQALGDASIKFDISKFNWLGRFTPGGEATAIWHTSPTKTLCRRHEARDDARGDQRGIVVGFVSAADEPPGWHQFKIVKGYRGIAGTVLAMERGETEGGARDRRAAPVRPSGTGCATRRPTVLVQYTLARHPAFPDAPAMVEFGKTPLDKQVLGAVRGHRRDRPRR